HVAKMNEFRDSVYEKIKSETSDYNLRANASRRQLVTFDVGQNVMLYFPPTPKQLQVSKLLPKFTGPWKVTQRLSDTFYIVDWNGSEEDRPRKVTHKVHIQRMKPFHEREPAPEEEKDEVLAKYFHLK